MQHLQVSTDVKTQQNAEKNTRSEAGDAPVNLALSDEDVRQLLENPSVDSRVEITARLTKTYSRSDMNPTESVVAEQIFRLLMRDVEVRVRACLASNIKESSTIPKDIVMELARDVKEVALPVLQYSQVLNDDDLIELIKSTTEISHHVAVSMRTNVSGKVADTLVDTGNGEVVQSLVSNDGAELSDNGLQKIIETFSGNQTILDSLSNRPQLPLAAVQKLMNVVSTSLAQELKKKYENQPSQAEKAEIVQETAKQIDKAVDAVKESETLDLLARAKSPDEIDKLITQLIAFDRLSPSLILRALCQGNFNFFEVSLARLANIPVANARKLIVDRGELGFRAIYNKSGLPDAMFPAVKLLNRVVHELSEEGHDVTASKSSNHIVERILQYSEDEPVDNLSYIIALIRRVSSN